MVMMSLLWGRVFKKFFLIIFLFVVLGLASPRPLYADLYINILAVNGTDQARDKEVQYYLPKELASSDILEVANGLELDYDSVEGAFLVHGKVRLAPKETKTLKVKVKDVWTIDNQRIQDIKDQANASVEILKDTEYYDNAQVKKQGFFQRLDYIVKQQELYADDVNKRIDQYRAYSKELEEIRNNAFSVKYWRSKATSEAQVKTVRFNVELQNPTDTKINTADQKFYLPGFPKGAGEH